MTREISTRMESNKEFAKFIFKCVERYARRDWGDTCSEDWLLNDEAINSDSRIVARYDNIFIITEWDKSITTILFTHEY